MLTVFARPDGCYQGAMRCLSLLGGSVAVLVATLSGCGPEAVPPETPPPAPASAPSPVVETAPPSKRPAYEDPGGMWMPEQLAPQAQTLKSLGLEIDAAAP